MIYFSKIISGSNNVTASMSVTGSIYHLPTSSSNRNFISVNTASGQFYYNNFYSEVKTVLIEESMSFNTLYRTSSYLSNFNLPVPGLYEVDIVIVATTNNGGTLMRLNGPVCDNWSGYVSDSNSLPPSTFTPNEGTGFTNRSRNYSQSANDSRTIILTKSQLANPCAKFFINVSNVNAPLNLEWRQTVQNAFINTISTGSMMIVRRIG